MNQDILTAFKALYEKQDMVSQLMNEELFTTYTHTEVHTLAIIGDSEEANGTYIADEISMTRSAVTKITNRLEDKKLITAYQKPDNKKSIFYKLTDEGKKVYTEHEKAHTEWESRDLSFLETRNSQEKEHVSTFLEAFNEYLDTILKGK